MSEKQIPDILRELRKSIEKTQTEIADFLGITQQTYSNYETGKREIPAHHVVKLSKLYKKSADYLLGLEEDFPPYYDGQKSSDLFLHDIINDIKSLSPALKISASDYISYLKSQDKI